MTAPLPQSTLSPDDPRWIDWEHRRRVISAVIASGGMACDAADRLGISDNNARKSAARLGMRFPARNKAMVSRDDSNPGGEKSGEALRRKQKAWREAIMRRKAFIAAMESGIEHPPVDELIEKAIAQGKLVKVPDGSALTPGWLSGIHDKCVKPRGGSKGHRI